MVPTLQSTTHTRAQSRTALDQKRKANFMEDKITAMVANEIEAEQHILFGGLTSRLTKTQHVA